MRAPRCEHCGDHLTIDHGTESADCAVRPVDCDRCGQAWTRDEMFWSGEDLIGDCCDDAREEMAKDV